MTEEPVFIDAFSGEGAGGNLAAVILLDSFPDTTEMQSVADAIEAPATAFACRTATGGAFPVRWFGQTREIALCGHGALAAGHVLLAQSGEDSLRLRTGDARELKLRKLPGAARYELALPAIPTQPREWPELAAALGCHPVQIRWNAAGYALAILDSPQEVAALAPDAVALAALGNVQVTASSAGSLAGFAADVTSRVFSPGGREDAATGSAHAVLAPYWSAHFGRAQFSAFQASASGGRFECRLEGGLVWLGGQCSDAGPAAAST